MPESRTIEQLTDLGMNSREAKLYVALLRANEATPAMLHRISGVPRTKTYETLDRMVASGMCSERVEGRRKFFRATRPAEVFALLQRHWDLEHQLKCRIADDAFGQLDELFRDASATDPALDQIEVIRSREQINLKFMLLTQACEQEILSFTRSPYAATDEATRAEQKRVQREQLARGLKITSIYMPESKDWGWLQTFVTELEEAGEDIRLCDDLPIKMFIFDRRRVLIALPSVPGLTGSDFTMLAVEDPGFTAGCVVLFETYWARAQTGPQWFAHQEAAVTMTNQAEA